MAIFTVPSLLTIAPLISRLDKGVTFPSEPLLNFIVALPFQLLVILIVVSPGSVVLISLKEAVSPLVFKLFIVSSCSSTVPLPKDVPLNIISPPCSPI